MFSNYFCLFCSDAIVFFFQAEDGIRDRDVTGVQTCALPIWARLHGERYAGAGHGRGEEGRSDRRDSGAGSGVTGAGGLGDGWSKVGRLNPRGRGGEHRPGLQPRGHLPHQPTAVHRRSSQAERPRERGGSGSSGGPDRGHRPVLGHPGDLRQLERVHRVPEPAPPSAVRWRPPGRAGHREGEGQEGRHAKARPHLRRGRGLLRPDVRGHPLPGPRQAREPEPLSFATTSQQGVRRAATRCGYDGSVTEQTVLVVDDEEAIAEAVRARLQSEGFQVVVAGDGPEAIGLCEQVHPDLVVLDLMLPGMDGLEVCRQIQRDRWVPVLMLTARTEEADKVAGFAVGADDYLTKPFSLRELVVRVRAILRRMERIGALPADEPIDRAGLAIDQARRTVAVDGTRIQLTPLEFEIILTLARTPGVVFTREQLMDKVWGYRDYAGGRVVDSHVARIRRKLGEDGVEPRFIRTVHGVGYAFRQPAEVP